MKQLTLREKFNLLKEFVESIKNYNLYDRENCDKLQEKSWHILAEITE